MLISFPKLSVCIFRRFPCRSVSNNNASHPGLLQGIEDISTAKYYTQNMDLKLAIGMIKDSKYIYNAALRDCEVMKAPISEYLLSCSSKAHAFIMSNEVWDREELTAVLSPVCKHLGKFVCLLGGKNTGKSFVLKSMVTNSKTPILYVDLRRHGVNIEAGVHIELQKMLNHLQPVESVMSSVLTVPFAASVLNAFSTAAGMPVNVSEILANFQKDDPNKRFLHLLTSLAYPNGLTLIIDEANLAFNVTKQEDIELAQRTLALFTGLTKQDRLINVILSSSEHAFPFRLGRLGFSPRNFTKLIFAGEVPPADMFALLTTRWGMGEHLATAFLNFYGGHVFDAYNAVTELDLQKSTYDQYSPWVVSLEIDALADCLALESDRTRMKKALVSLATTGFAPISSHVSNIVAETISACNIGGVVTLGATVVGLPPNTLTTDASKGLIPSKQSIRLLLAARLVD